MSISVYSLRSSTLGYRVTKITDGEPEGSYHTSHAECDCPAGSRPTCRHRQMLPRMLGANLLDAEGFWDHDHNRICDIDGRAMALPKGPKEDTLPSLPKGPEIEPPPYGISPMMQAMPLMKQWNDLPQDERVKAAADFINERQPWRRI